MPKPNPPKLLPALEEEPELPEDPPEEMPDEERAALNAGLLRYCELDTLAMVMIVEAWREMVN